MAGGGSEAFQLLLRRANPQLPDPAVDAAFYAGSGATGPWWRKRKRKNIYSPRARRRGHGWGGCRLKRPDGDTDVPQAVVEGFTVPPCAACGAGVITPDVVFFGGSLSAGT